MARSYLRHTMKRTFQTLVLTALAVVYAQPLDAQEAPGNAEVIRQRREMEEQLKTIQNLQSDLQQVQAKQLTLEKRLADLQEDMRLQKADSARDTGRYLTRDDLKRLDTDLVKLSTSIKEVDKNREADKKLMLETLEQMGTAIKEMRKLINVAAHITPPKAPPKNEKSEESTSPAADKPDKIKAFTHKVASGENLSVIIKAYNDKLKEEGVTKRITLDMVLKANPGLKPERMQIGQEILIPDPR